MTPVSIQSTSFDVEPDQPCAATASLFLFAQGRSILCLHHDTLAVERRFEKHKQAVVLISVDNVSERGAGRLVVSYDGERTAIVWDLFTGDEIARFASYEQIKVAAWMKNGNVAFGMHTNLGASHRDGRPGLIMNSGNSQGNVILFEPSTSDHRSARTIFDPITALAPAADCQTYAIGFVFCIRELSTGQADTLEDIKMGPSCSLPFNLTLLSCTPCQHLEHRHQLLA